MTLWLGDNWILTLDISGLFDKRILQLFLFCLKCIFALQLCFSFCGG